MNIGPEIDILSYLIHVAPVVFVMGVALIVLWKKNDSLIEKIHERDLQNLKTLEEMLRALRQIEQKGDLHFDQLKTHISERIQSLREQL
jgi:predicted PurR-regulated permease PerM